MHLERELRVISAIAGRGRAAGSTLDADATHRLIYPQAPRVPHATPDARWHAEKQVRLVDRMAPQAEDDLVVLACGLLPRSPLHSRQEWPVAVIRGLELVYLAQLKESAPDAVPRNLQRMGMRGWAGMQHSKQDGWLTRPDRTSFCTVRKSLSHRLFWYTDRISPLALASLTRASPSAAVGHSGFSTNTNPRQYFSSEMPNRNE